MRRNRLLPVAVCSLALLAASCSDVTDNDGNALPPGKYPITFTAGVDRPAPTRATTDNTWAGSEEVAVQIGSEVKKYTAAQNGTLTAASGVTPWYWQTTTETKNVSAWYPYSTAKPAATELTVKADQSGNGYQASDHLEAAAVAVTFGNPKNLTFKHRTAKVVVTLTAGEGLTTADMDNATVTFLNQTGVEGGRSEITSKKETTGGSTTYSALVIPQQMQNLQFIQVTIGTGEYLYTPTNNTDLTAGKQYTYNITVNKNGLTVTEDEEAAWSDSGSTTEVPSKELASGFDPFVLKIGDYYYSDGTWSDGGYRKYSDSTTDILSSIMPVLKDAGGNARTVVGIVFYVGDITGDDPLLKEKFPSGTNGLVVALKNASDDGSLWSNAGYNITMGWLDPLIYKIENLHAADKMQGYANTQALRGYNESEQVTDYPTYKVLPIGLIDTYSESNPTPDASSGWYWPSVMELKTMCLGQGVTSPGTIGRDMLDMQFGKVGGSSFDQVNYWSSSEGEDTNPYSKVAQRVHLKGGETGTGVKTTGKYRIRSILAF